MDNLIDDKDVVAWWCQVPSMRTKGFERKLVFSSMLNIRQQCDKTF